MPKVNKVYVWRDELGIHRLCKCGDGQSLCQTGNTFEQNVSARQQSDEQRVDQMFLTYNDFAHLHIEGVNKYAFAFDLCVEFFDIYNFTHSVC